MGTDMSGSIGILNVGAGDTKIVFDSSDPIETIRAGRIVSDMLKRGYALLVKLEDGSYRRVYEFDEKTCEYVIADYDPQPETVNEQAKQTAPKGRAGRPRRIPATTADGIAVSRTAGG